jgi:hypothetical protein
MKWVQMGIHKTSLGVFHKGTFCEIAQPLHMREGAGTALFVRPRTPQVTA